MSLLKVNTVETSLIQNTGGTGAPAIREMPAFRAHLSTTQSITSEVITKVNIDTKTGTGYFDTNDWFDTTNKRYIPQISGYYFFSGQVRMIGTSQNTQAVYLYKNGSRYVVALVTRFSTSSAVILPFSSIAYMNGSTDYMELWALCTATSPSFDFGDTTSTSVFEGYLVRPDL
jgi:hypothetical protein